MGTIEWNVHLSSPVEQVFRTVSTEMGRESFWAESATEREGKIHFEFPDGTELRSKILRVEAPHEFTIEYFNGVVRFEFARDGDGGTDLSLRHEGVDSDAECNTQSGWVSVLLSLKAAVDHDVDLRNHEADRTWSEGFVGN